MAVRPLLPPHAASAEDPEKIVNEFWDAFEELFSRYNQKLIADEDPPLKQKELAEAAGVNDRTFSDWRNKRTVPADPASLVKAARLLGGRQEDWQARWRRARDAHERLVASRQGQRKPGSEGDRGPVLPSGASPSGADESAHGKLPGHETPAGGPSAGADRSARRARPRPRSILVVFAILAVIAIAAAITVIVLENNGTGQPPDRPQVQPLSGHAKMSLQPVQVPLTSQLAALLGRTGATSSRTITGYEFRNAAGNNSAPVCLGALTTGSDAGQNHDPVRAMSCSGEPNEIWIPIQWDLSHQNLSWLVNDQYQSMCLNVNEKSGDGSAAQLWDCYHYSYGPNSLAINEAWDFGDWYANMTSRINPYPLFLGSSDFSLSTDNQGSGQSNGNSLPDGTEVDIWNYSRLAANQYWY
jgi:hypothetical protein